MPLVLLGLNILYILPGQVQIPVHPRRHSKQLMTTLHLSDILYGQFMTCKYSTQDTWKMVPWGKGDGW